MRIKNSLFVLLGILNLLVACSDKDNNLDPLIDFEIPDQQIDNAPEIITTVDRSKCDPFKDAINPISNEDFNVLVAKDVEEISNNILIALNIYRKAEGLSELSSNPTAKYLALQHNDYQINLNDINHDNSQFRSCAIFELENAQATGENVAFGFTTAKTVVNAWLESPSHLENIRGDFSKTGIAVTQNSNNVLFYTNIFFK